MNLVVDDAVEVLLATKEEGEKRRELGLCSHWVVWFEVRKGN
jgi:hypothetical protein